MSKTSIRDYTIAGLTGGFIVTMIILAVFSVPDVFDISGFENTSFNSFDNLTDYASKANETASNTYETTADSGVFDVIGTLIVKSFKAVKTFFSSINFLTSSVDNMLNSLGIGVQVSVIATYITTIIIISIAAVFLFRIINKTEDDK